MRASLFDVTQDVDTASELLVGTPGLTRNEDGAEFGSGVPRKAFDAVVTQLSYRYFYYLCPSSRAVALRLRPHCRVAFVTPGSLIRLKTEAFCSCLPGKEEKLRGRINADELLGSMLFVLSSMMLVVLVSVFMRGESSETLYAIGYARQLIQMLARLRAGFE